MGGRGRDFSSSEKWAWVGELSDSRLERYGRMSSTKDESDIGKMALNYECSKEFERRHGCKPEWEK
ncbi:MAG: hypothetical protein AB7U29_20080 [Desulfobulbus sp.]